MLNWRDLKNPKSGGAEVLTEGILRELVLHGHDITLFCARFPGALSHELVSGYRVIRRGQFWSVHVAAWWHWMTHFRKEHFDIVIDQIHGLPFFTPLYIRSRKIKSGDSTRKFSPEIFAFIHEVAGEIWFKMYPFPISLIGYLIEKIYFRLYRQYDFITVSESTKEDLMKMGIPAERISIIPEAINPIQHSNTSTLQHSSSPSIIYVGRIAPMKRVDELIDAFGLVLKEIPDAKLWIVGGGEKNYIESLKSLSPCHPGAGRDPRFPSASPVTFFGKVSEEKKYELMASATVLASASLKEGFGLVILEAGSVGTPAVVYNIHGFRDAVQNGKTGILCEENSPENLAQNLRKVIKDKNLRATLGVHAREYSKQFTFPHAAREFEMLLLK